MSNPAGELTDRLQLLHLEQLGLRLDARRRLGLHPAVEIGVHPFQLGVRLSQLRCPLRYPMVQLLVGDMQFFIGHLEFFGEHRGLLERRSQLPCRTLVPQRASGQRGQLRRVLPNEHLDLPPAQILFTGQRSDFRVRVFQCDPHLLEFLS